MAYLSLMHHAESILLQTINFTQVMQDTLPSIDLKSYKSEIPSAKT